MGKIYLCNGKDGYGNTLNVLRDSKLIKGFSDIAILDLTTMEIPKKNADAYFKGLNPNTDLSGDYYVASIDLEHIYAPIFEPENKEAKKYINELKSLTISRYNNIKNKQKVDKLNRNEAEDLSRRILTNIYNRLDDKQFAEITNMYTCISDDLQDKIVLKNWDTNKKKTVDDYVNKIILHDCRNLITSYTVIRDLVVSYARLIDGEKIKLATKEVRNGFIDSAGDGMKANQLKLTDFM